MKNKHYLLPKQGAFHPFVSTLQTTYSPHKMETGCSLQNESKVIFLIVILTIVYCNILEGESWYHGYNVGFLPNQTLNLVPYGGQDYRTRNYDYKINAGPDFGALSFNYSYLWIYRTRSFLGLWSNFSKVEICKSIHCNFLLKDESCSPHVCSELINLFPARIKH